MKSSDWHAFRDPNEEWGTDHLINNTKTSRRQVQQKTSEADRERVRALERETWVDVGSQARERLDTPSMDWDACFPGG